MTTDSLDPTADPAVTRLSCPECGHEWRVETAGLIDGGDMRCERCQRDWVLQHERIGHGQHSRWELIEPGDDDEP